MKVALLISTYNWPRALKTVLVSVSRQSRCPDEILIADDGSGPKTQHVIKTMKEQLGLPMRHIWQDDAGFRKSAVLNKAVASTAVDYIIQVDGDCILHKDFIKDHLSGIEENTFLYGSRVNIKPGAVNDVLEMEVPKFHLFSNAIKNKSRNLRIPIFQKLYGSKTCFSEKTRGCNLSYWRNDFISVNGYNETLEGWGREDSEFVIRLLNKKIKGKRLRYGGIVYHIYHPEESRKSVQRNTEIQQRTIQEKKVWCREGVEKYLPEHTGKNLGNDI